MEQPLISILMAVYNASDFLAEAIDSVRAQTYPNWELICVDDGSTDSSLSILTEAARSDSRIQVLSQTNAGAANARNTALNRSTGRYVCILDADDRLSPDYLEQTLAAITRDPENDCAMPELYVWHWRDESKSYSCNDCFVTFESLTSFEALVLSIPWRIHAFCLWNGDMVRKIGYRTDGYITSDEVSSRDFFAHCRKVVQSFGRYYYRYNEQSITKKISSKPIGKVMTNIQLREIAVAYEFPPEELKRITTDFFFELIAWAMYYMRNKQGFSAVERRQAREMLHTAYKQRFIHDVCPRGWGERLRKIFLGHNFGLFMSVCGLVAKVR